MEQKNHIQEELSQLESQLPVLRCPYQVPGGYFENLAERATVLVKLMDVNDSHEELSLLSPNWPDTAKHNPYLVPKGYFENLDLSFVWAEEDSVSGELAALSPLLAGMKKDHPFTVPQGFFDDREVKAIPVAEAPPAKLVRFSTRRWFRMAAAAVVTGLVATAALLFFRSNNTIDPNQKSYAWVEKNLKKVETADIDKLVELAGLDQTATASVSVSPEVKSLMQDVSDLEIQQFLNDAGVSDDDMNDIDDEIILN